MEIAQPSGPSSSGVKSFFTSSSDNRQKQQKPKLRRRRSIFSFNNSSSSSLDNDLAFGSAFSKKPTGNKNKKGKKNKESDRDVDAELLGLSATATALAASSDDAGRPNRRRPGEILASRPRRQDTRSSGPGTTDEDWEDSEGRSVSSASSALAFGGDSSPYAGSEESSDSGKSGWGWRWGSKRKDKKKKNKGDKFPTAPVVAGAAAVGAAALYSHEKDSAKDGSSIESLRRLDPMPTSDPSQFEPTLVRPGEIPLQQPQPVTPVSQAVYSTQGESIPAYMAAAEPVPLPYGSREAPPGPWDHDMMYNYPEPEPEPEPERTDIVERVPRRRDSSPSRGSAISGSSRRRSMPKDQGSVVQFDLTREQEDRQRRADLREQKKRESSRDQGIQLVDHEREEDSRERRREPSRSRSRDDRSRQDSEKEPSLVGPAVAGAIGAAATSSILSRSDDGDDKHRQESRERRRAQRRMSDWDQPPPTSDIEDKPRRESSSPSKPVHNDYAAFFAPEELKSSRSGSSPKGEREIPRDVPQPIIHQDPPYQPALRTYTHAQEPMYPGYGLPWPVPQLNLIEPTPPHSHNGSVRDDTSPIPPYAEPREADVPPTQDLPRDLPQEVSRDLPQDVSWEMPEEGPSGVRRQSGSRVSWGPHQMHEYEVPSEHESVDDDFPRELPSKDSSKQPSAEDGIEFAATLAAGAAAAGFDPTVVTDDPSYMRSGPETNREPVPSMETGPQAVPEAMPQEKPLPLRVKNINRDSPEVVQSPSLPRERPRRRPRELAEVLKESAPTPAEPLEQAEPAPLASFEKAEPEPRETRSVLSRIPVKGEKRRSSLRGLDDIPVTEDRDGKEGSDKENQPGFEKV